VGGEPSIDEVTDPMVSARPRAPSPTPVSHIGASARTVTPRIGPGSTPSSLRSGPRPRSRWLPVLVIAASVLVVAGLIAVLVAWSGGTRLGSWASSPEQGSQSPLEPVQLDQNAARDAE